MLERTFRMLTGFVMACLAAGFTKVLFAVPPSELFSLPPDVASDRLGRLFDSGLFAAVWSGIFALPFAIVAAAIGEWRRFRAWTYYVAVAVAVALVGFVSQHMAEEPGQPSILNGYGFTAFLMAGFLGGLFYWLFAGRLAGGVARTVGVSVDQHPADAIPHRNK